MKCNNTLCKRHLTNGECVKLLGEECQYDQLTKAKEIIKEYVNWDYGDKSICLPDITKEAEQFLKKVEK